MTANARRWLSMAVRLLIVVAAVLWLSREPRFWSDLWHTIRSADTRLLLIGLAIFGPAPVLSVFRLKALLAVHDIRVSTWELMKIVFGGNFLIFSLPIGTSGGDAAKAFYVAQRTPYKHEAVTTVFFDRLIGVVGLVLLSGTMVLINWHDPAMAQWGRPIGIVAIFFFIGAAAYFSGTVRRLVHLEQFIHKLPLGHHIHRIDQAVLAFRRHGKRVAFALALTVLLQVTGIISLYFVGWGLDLVGTQPLRALFIYLAYVPICFLTGALPLGAMELTFQQLFAHEAHLGTPAAAVSLALLSRVVQLIWSLPGALVVIGGGYRISEEQMREVEAELDENAAPALGSVPVTPMSTHPDARR